MTHPRQAEREAQARAWLHKWESMDGARFFIGGDRESFFEAFVALLAANELAVLEEVVHKLAMGAVKNNGPFAIEHVIHYLRQLAQKVQG
ncbi:MAG: hypothetical protein OEV08_05075 [Nitrospira sp.]|nr:hypothetical protein [Nitrospira sp.]